MLDGFRPFSGSGGGSGTGKRQARGSQEGRHGNSPENWQPISVKTGGMDFSMCWIFKSKLPTRRTY
ncbi:MAG TPA: hypothetical protein DCZ94_22445 [Lentisphaeria bacterium]|nr:MAG: hypothetical protein A2X48_13685 [Lentisphaerae bacterium GWF2_49_21]HBC89709.1 hypothetical protein [Lentisphaeria bacterium]